MSCKQKNSRRKPPAQKIQGSLKSCPGTFSSVLFSKKIGDFRKPAYDFTVILPFMWIQTGGAVFDAFFVVHEITSASLTQNIERAVAEKAVEIFSVCSGMTGKVFAFFMPEVGIFFFRPVLVQARFSSVFFWIVRQSVHSGFLPLSWQRLLHRVYIDPLRWLHSIPARSGRPRS